MPIGLGLACSHAPGMYVFRDMTKAWLTRTINRSMERGFIVPSTATALTEKDLDEHWQRFRNDHAVLKKKLEEYNPDALIFVGGGRSEMFQTSRECKIAIFTGPECYGYDSGTNFAGKTGEQNYVRVKTDVALAKQVADALTRNPMLDVVPTDIFKPSGPAMLQDDFANPPEIFHRKDLPCIIISMRYGDDYNQGMKVSGEMCYEMGRSLARIFEHDKKRIAILGTGGMSHDPGGPRNMWVDEPLDNWVFKQITEGNGSALQDLYAFDSMTLRGGTRELAAWIVAAGAMDYMGIKATKVDYINSPEAQTGLGFAYWQSSAAK